MAVRWDRMIYHIPIYTIDIGCNLNYTLNNEIFARTPMDVVRMHVARSAPVYEGVIPMKPIVRQAWELRKEHIRLISKIGEGAYGEVHSGMLQVQKTAGMVEVEVAVKLMKMTEETKPQLEKMHQEARLMRQYNHRNVVRLHGCLFSESDVYIVMEMVKGGSLESYLKKNPQLAPLHRHSFAYDVAAGLAYLHKRNCMHRDIAARNCLVEEGGKTVKLSDFGLSVHGRRFQVPVGERVPIRWSAPEVLVHRIYTRESDVWSYGMLVWEIFNDGKEPFVGHDTPFIRANIGKRSFRPPVDHIKWYQELKVLVPRCWEVETPKRPTMERIAEHLVRYCIHEVGDDQKNKERVIIRTKEVRQKQAKMRQTKPVSKGKGPIRSGPSVAPPSSSRTTSSTSQTGPTKNAISQMPGRIPKKAVKKETPSKRQKRVEKPKKGKGKKTESLEGN